MRIDGVKVIERLVRATVGLAVGVYIGVAVVTALIAESACKLACQASTPIGPVASVVMGACWPMTLPGLLHSIRFPVPAV